MTVATQSYEFRAEIQQLLNILVHSLYTDREIFLRELVSNASDAINRLQFEMLTNSNIVDADAELKITIAVDKDAKTITITDNGIGMNQEELIANLGTIAHSGALSFMNALKEKGNTTTDIIGQFGVGFYSVFMIADKVQVISRSFRPEESAYCWVSDGGNQYTIELADKTTRGTEITLFVKEDADEFLTDYRLERIVKKHSNYIAFPIQIGDKVVNDQTAIWRRTPREVTVQEYQDFYKQLTYDPGEPLFQIHQVSDAPVQFYSLIFVPSRLDRGLFNADTETGPRLYARKVLIQERAKDLLPQWMRFVEGVVDSEDLPLNISRETVQANKVMSKLKNTISSKIISEMESLASKDAEKFTQLWTEFGRMIKEGVATDASNRERLTGLLRFHTSRDTEGWVSLQEYMDRMVEGQEDIYYLFGEDLRSVVHSPHLDIFRSRGIEVILMTDTIDSFMMNALFEFKGKKLRSGADPDLELPNAKDEPQGEALSDDEMDQVIGAFKTTLGERVADVRISKVLTESPARLVNQDKGFGADMERVYRMLDKEFAAPKRILELNPRHNLIRNLAALGNDEMVATVAEQLFESALLIEGIHPNPADMIPRIQALMEAATRR